MPTKKKIRLIHTSDTHLGDDWHAQLSEQALRTLVGGVAKLNGDALLLVGDVFDHARVSDATLEFFVQQMGRLAVPAIVLPGNHDLYDETSLYLREPFRNKSSNLHILSKSNGEMVSFPDLTLDVWGRAMPAHTPEFQPLLGMEAPCHYLALGHWERHVDVSQGDTRAVYSGSPLGALQSNDQVTVTVADLDPDSGVQTHQATLDMLV